jgi:hypothetical protein
MRTLKFVLMLAAFAFVSCEKGEDSKSGATKMELITKAAWKYDHAALDMNKDGQVDTDLPAGYVTACEKDNTLLFKADGSGIGDEGPTKCDQGDPQTTNFNWSFANGEQNVVFEQSIFTNIDGNVTILTLNDTKLELLKEVQISPGQSVNVIVRFKH